MSTDGTAPPVLRVVRGDATPEEVAALVVVLAASASAAPVPSGPVSRWGAAADAVRAPVTPGPDAWRTSAWSR